MYSIPILSNQNEKHDNYSLSILKKIDNRDYKPAHDEAKQVIDELKQLKLTFSSESELNSVYILSQFYELLSSVSIFWKYIENNEFYNSWSSLQDGLDYLRQIKKFNNNKHHVLTFFEKQLIQLETLYPYTLFSSPGFIVERFECSICKNDIDSKLCPHMKGELYSGEIAYAVAQKIRDIDHFAIVTSPTNKRLVVDYDDEHTQFGLFKEVVEHFKKGELSPLGFSTLKRTEFMRSDPNWRKLPRNSICYCGSDKKYKKCCVNNSQIKQIHVDFMGSHIFKHLESDKGPTALPP